jgi:hypothetical protein
MYEIIFQPVRRSIGSSSQFMRGQSKWIDVLLYPRKMVHMTSDLQRKLACPLGGNAVMLNRVAQQEQGNRLDERIVGVGRCEKREQGQVNLGYRKARTPIVSQAASNRQSRKCSDE